MKRRERTAAALLAALCLTATACGGQPGPEEAATTAVEDLSAYAAPVHTPTRGTASS